MLDPTSILRGWHTRLSKLDHLPVRAGWSPVDWRLACDDACWLYETLASHAVRDGWDAADLFGMLPARPGWGGLCDRLRGARDLAVDAQWAAWSRYGIGDRFCRGGGEALKASGLVPIWQPASTMQPPSPNPLGDALPVSSSEKEEAMSHAWRH